MILTWPVGAPAGLALLLWHRRDAIQKPICERDENSALNNWRFLFDAYKPEAWYWELVITARRLGTMALVMLSHGSPLQLTLGMVLTIGALAAQIHYKPFVVDSTNVLAFASEIQISLAVVVGLVSLVHEDAYDGREGTAMGVLMVILTVAIFILGFGVPFISALRSGDRGGMMQAVQSIGIGKRSKSGTKQSISQPTRSSVSFMNPNFRPRHVKQAAEVEMQEQDGRSPVVVDLEAIQHSGSTTFSGINPLHLSKVDDSF